MPHYMKILRAVEAGEIPIAVATEIALADDASIQQTLVEAYKTKQLRGKALLNARRLIEDGEMGRHLSGEHRGNVRAPTLQFGQPLSRCRRPAVIGGAFDDAGVALSASFRTDVVTGEWMRGLLERCLTVLADLCTSTRPAS